jgi:hypothetical protein
MFNTLVHGTLVLLHPKSTSVVLRDISVHFRLGNILPNRR